mgnify:FL=1
MINLISFKIFNESFDSKLYSSWKDDPTLFNNIGNKEQINFTDNDISKISTIINGIKGSSEIKYSIKLNPQRCGAIDMYMSIENSRNSLYGSTVYWFEKFDDEYFLLYLSNLKNPEYGDCPSRYSIDGWDGMKQILRDLLKYPGRIF